MGSKGEVCVRLGRNSDALNGSLAIEGRVQLSVLEFDNLQVVHTVSLSINSTLQNISQNFLTYRNLFLYI